jgi:hypothetical protein
MMRTKRVPPHSGHFSGRRSSVIWFVVRRTMRLRGWRVPFARQSAAACGLAALPAAVYFTPRRPAAKVNDYFSRPFAYAPLRVCFAHSLYGVPSGIEAPTRENVASPSV